MKTKTAPYSTPVYTVLARTLLATTVFCAMVMTPLSGAQTKPATSAESAESAGSAPAAQPAANPGGPAAAISQLRAFIQRTASASGNFVQLTAETNSSSSGGGDSSRGSFVFARPGKFRWEVTEPYPQLLVADGTDVYFHDPDLNQVTVRPMAGALGATPAAILFGTGDLDENFVMTELDMVDGVNWLQASPKVREAGFEQIRIGFADNIPVEMEVLDAFNRTTRFQFSGMVRNPALDASTFNFAIPKGADVVRQ